MANTKSKGFKPVTAGGIGTPEVVRKRVLTNNTRRIATFDALDAQTGGDVIAHATAAGAVYSVCLGTSFIDTAGFRRERQSLPAATLYTSSGIDPSNASYAYAVEDVVNTVFKISVDTVIALTDLNLNYAMVVTQATGDYSLHELDGGSSVAPATTANNGGWRVTDFVLGDSRSAPDTVDAAVFCKVNMGRRSPALLTVGSLGT